MSDVDSEHLSVLPLGERLAAVRRARGLELREVERETRIRGRYLTAIEQERFDLLPGEGYAAVFLRTYAAYLGLDPDACAEEFRRRHVKSRALPVPAPDGGIGRRTWAALVTAALVGAAALAAGLMLGLRSGDEPAGGPPAGPARTAPGETAPAPPVVANAVSITAVRGTTRVVARLDGPGGDVVWQGRLRAGRTLRLGVGRPLWIRLGAPERVRVRLGDRRPPAGARTFRVDRHGFGES